MKTVPPSVRETAFSCPHCYAFTTQYWYDILANDVSAEKRLPFVASDKQRENVSNNPKYEPNEKKSLLVLLDEMLTGLVLLDREKSSKYASYSVRNLHLSECYNCKKIAVWVADRLLFPVAKSGVLPNPDLPAAIKLDFEEAREIVEASPRGAAALLRLTVQKLCAHLGERGKKIDDDIASLVKKGLNPLVQQALDIVRVIGNEAVHPGVLDLKDDRETAQRLFDLVNAIADQMITHPKAVSDLYGKLPQGKRKAIEMRDKS